MRTWVYAYAVWNEMQAMFVQLTPRNQMRCTNIDKAKTFGYFRAAQEELVKVRAAADKHWGKVYPPAHKLRLVKLMIAPVTHKRARIQVK